MSEPEIARRCPSCGVSIRVRGSFCPQCGKPISEQKSGSGSREESSETAEILAAADTVSVDLSSVATTELTDTLAETSKLTTTQSETVPLQRLPTEEEIPIIEPAQERARAAVPTRNSTSHKPTTGVRGAVGRARAARDVIEGDVMQGVGRLREISTVVLDEASYDPSLRFVLVAIVLFVLFLIILILSEVMN